MITPKKILIILAAFFCFFGSIGLIPVSAAGLTPPPVDTNVSIDTSPPSNSVEEAINNIVNWFFVVVLIIAVIFLLWAGFLFITAAGDPDKVNSARQNVMYAAVGVAVAVLAKGIVSLVQGIMGGGAGGNGN